MRTPVTEIPASFLDLHRTGPGGRLKARLADVAERHEFCEDLAQMLVDTARDARAHLQVTEDDVLERIGRGLRGPQAPVDPAEAGWVLRRLAELLQWAPVAAIEPDPDTVPPATR
jgi:hypothetical protein